MTDPAGASDQPPAIEPAPRKKRGVLFWLLVVGGVMVAVCAGGVLLVFEKGKDWIAIAQAPEGERSGLLSKKLEEVAGDRMLVIDRYLAAVDEARDDDAWALTTDSFKATTTRDEFTELTTLVRSVTGRVTSRELRNYQSKSMLGGAEGSTLTFAAKFEKGDGSIVMDVEAAGGEWMVRGWRVNSPLFVEAMKRGGGK